MATKGVTIQRAPNDNFHNKNSIGGHNQEIYARNLNLGSGPGHLSYFPAEVAHPYAWPTRTHFLILVTLSRSGSSLCLANQNYCFYRRNFEPKWLIRSPGQPELIFDPRNRSYEHPKMSSGWPGTGMSHFGSKLRASKSEFWLARHRDESLRLEVTRVKK